MLVTLVGIEISYSKKRRSKNLDNLLLEAASFGHKFFSITFVAEDFFLVKDNIDIYLDLLGDNTLVYLKLQFL